MTKDVITIKGARENNLKNVSLDIPRNKISVFTGVSGSGKSSLVFDTIATESQRQLNETYSAFIRNFLPKYSKPEVDAIDNLSVSIVVDQKRLGGNSRSTLGTITDIYSTLRLLFAKFGTPHVGSAYMFSFNDANGMCPECEGIGISTVVDLDTIFDTSKSLNEGAILLPIFKVDAMDWNILTYPKYFDQDKKLADYDSDEWKLLLHGNNGKKIKMEFAGSAGINITYEGVIEKFTRRYVGTEISETSKAKNAKYLTQGTCQSCQGARLNPTVLSCKIGGYNIAEMTAMEVSKLKQVIDAIDEKSAQPLTHAISSQLEHLISMGLDYISLNRETTTLSGGESQRVKMVKYLNSSLSNMIYIFDEPSIGLHPRDVARLNTLLKKLRDKGNTILVVEHDPDVIKIADNIVDIGPHAGTNGGEIVFQGTLSNLLQSDTLTGKFLNHQFALKKDYRKPKGAYKLTNITHNNLKNVSVEIPKNVLTVVTGVAGSGKSSLINKAFVKAHPEAIVINQDAVSANVRSNSATFTGIMDEIRTLFAKANNVLPAFFSPNSKSGGACPNCQGLGFVSTDLAYLDSVRSTCEICEGKRFTEQTMSYKLDGKGKGINEVLNMTFMEALAFFKTPTLKKTLQSLVDVGIGYVTLGQPLSTLSGGECQRIKLAKELHKNGSIYVMDEPTTGLHMSDIDKIIGIMNMLVDKGNTVIVIEHNLDIIKNADWIIDIGPEGGKNGGQIVFEGTPEAIIKAENSLTGQYLKGSLTSK
jgi:excinuclease UvrABC ATPase subunit